MLQDMCRVSFLIIRIPVTFNRRSPDEPGSQIRLRECKENCNDENETRVYDTRTCATESPCYTLPVPHCDEWTEWGECRGTTTKCQDPRKTRTQSCVGRLIVTPTLVRWAVATLPTIYMWSFKWINRMRIGELLWRCGDRCTCRWLLVSVQETSKS